MKRTFLAIVAIFAIALSLTSCGGGDSKSSSKETHFALGEYVTILQNAVAIDKELKGKLETIKDSKELEKLIAEAQSEMEKYKAAVNSMTEQDMGKDAFIEIAEGAPFILETPLKFGKSLPYSDAIWVKLEGEIGVNGEVTLPEGKQNLVANLNVLDKEGNVLYTKKNFATFKGTKNEEGTSVVAADAKAQVGEYIVIKEKAVEDWGKAAKLLLVIAE